MDITHLQTGVEDSVQEARNAEEKAKKTITDVSPLACLPCIFVPPQSLLHFKKAAIRWRRANSSTENTCDTQSLPHGPHAAISLLLVTEDPFRKGPHVLLAVCIEEASSLPFSIPIHFCFHSKGNRQDRTDGSKIGIEKESIETKAFLGTAQKSRN